MSERSGKHSRRSNASRPSGDVAFCTECGARLRLRGKSAGRRITCPKCKKTVIVSADARSASAGDAETLTNQAMRATADETGKPSKERHRKLPIIEGYEVTGELGHGGMGVVYRARDLKLKREVALKMVLAGAHASETKLKRFRAEAESVAKLGHPNIVQIFEIGESDGLPYFSLEFVEGGSLEDRLRGKPRNPHKAAEFLETLARALDYAHRQGIVHRDLKPANILLTADGSPKVTDFGLAKQLEDEQDGRTKTGAVLGTPAYMAPEQAEGEAREAGPAADVYSLGAILYELLTCQPPFKGESVAETLIKVRTEEPVPPRLLRERIPRDLETICLKCLQKDPQHRYDAAGALADDLRRFIDHEPIAARPVGRVERAVRWVKRRPAVVGLLGALGLAAILGAAALASLTSQYLSDRAREQAEADRKQAQRRVEQESRRRERTESLAAYNTQIRRAWDVLPDDPQQAATLLEDPDQCPEELREFTWRLLSGYARPRVRSLIHRGATCAVFSDDGSRIITGGDGRVIVWNVYSGDDELKFELKSLAERTDFPRLVENVSSIALSPDGGMIALGAGYGPVSLWNAESGEFIKVLGKVEAHGKVTSLAFSPDGSTLAAARERKSFRNVIRRWDVGAGEQLAEYRGTGPVCFSPTGRTLVGSGPQGWNVESGAGFDADGGKTQFLTFLPKTARRGALPKLLWTTADGVIHFAQVDRSPALRDESVLARLPRPADFVFNVPDVANLSAPLQRTRFLAASSIPDGVAIFDAETGQRVAVLPGPRTSSGQLDHHVIAASPSGKLVATMSVQGVELWDVNAILRRPTTVVDSLSEFAFTENGRKIRYLSNRSRIEEWDVGTRRISTLLEHVPSENVAFGPSGRLLAFVEYEENRFDPQVHIVDLDDGEEVGVLDSEQLGRIRGLAFSPDGAALVSIASETLHVWDVRSGTERLTPVPAKTFGERNFEHFGGIVFHPNEGWAGLRLWGNFVFLDLKSGTKRNVFAERPKELLEGMAFIPNGSQFVTVHKEEDESSGSSVQKRQVLTFWAAGNGERASTIRGPMSDFLAKSTLTLSPDGRTLAVAAPEMLVLYDAETGHERLVLKQEAMRTPWKLKFSKNGRLLACSCAFGDRISQLLVWNGRGVEQRVNSGASDSDEAPKEGIPRAAATRAQEQYRHAVPPPPPLPRDSAASDQGLEDPNSDPANPAPGAPESVLSRFLKAFSSGDRKTAGELISKDAVGALRLWRTSRLNSTRVDAMETRFAELQIKATDKLTTDRCVLRCEDSQSRIVEFLLVRVQAQWRIHAFKDSADE